MFSPVHTRVGLKDRIPLFINGLKEKDSITITIALALDTFSLSISKDRVNGLKKGFSLQFY